MTKFELATLLFAPAKWDAETLDTIECNGGERVEGRVVGVAMEDGSGHRWNVTLALRGGGQRVVFVRTID